MLDTSSDRLAASVIVLTYEQSEFLPWVLRSLIDQDCVEPYEIIVTDDGSSPRTFAVLGSLGSHRTVKYVWHPHFGNRAGTARNNGIRLSSGRIIIGIDGDVIVPRDFIRRHLAAHAGIRPLIVAGPRRWLDSESLGDSFISHAASIPALGHIRPDWHLQVRLFRSHLPWMSCWACNYSIPRRDETLFDEEMPGSWHEDYELFCRLYHRHGFDVVYDESLFVYHVESSSESTWSPWSSGRPGTIENYIRNCLYVRRKFAELDLTAAMWPLTNFVQDPLSGQWRRATPSELLPLDVAIDRAEAWLRSAD